MRALVILVAFTVCAGAAPTPRPCAELAAAYSIPLGQATVDASTAAAAISLLDYYKNWIGPELMPRFDACRARLEQIRRK